MVISPPARTGLLHDQVSIPSASRLSSIPAPLSLLLCLPLCLLLRRQLCFRPRLLESVLRPHVPAQVGVDRQDVGVVVAWLVKPFVQQSLLRAIDVRLDTRFCFAEVLADDACNLTGHAECENVRGVAVGRSHLAHRHRQTVERSLIYPALQIREVFLGRAQSVSLCESIVRVWHAEVLAMEIAITREEGAVFGEALPREPLSGSTTTMRSTREIDRRRSRHIVPRAA